MLRFERSFSAFIFSISAFNSTIVELSSFSFAAIFSMSAVKLATVSVRLLISVATWGSFSLKSIKYIYKNILPFRIETWRFGAPFAWEVPFADSCFALIATENAVNEEHPSFLRGLLILLFKNSNCGPRSGIFYTLYSQPTIPLCFWIMLMAKSKSFFNWAALLASLQTFNAACPAFTAAISIGRTISKGVENKPIGGRNPDW